MMHAAEGTLLEMLDGRLPRLHYAQLQAHVAECASCAAELDRLRRLSVTFHGAMAVLDPPAPTRAAYAAVRSRRRGGWMTDTRRTLARAAMLVLGVVGVASATLPGSP
ncbi:anti-sigma factor family protein, partial [Longimicrobium sp.]|uniref:anti-sigma factor family protein n=1 Tax=Longimicrobium sp. TaxID=2029185 RepID=UPI002F9599D3